MSAPFALLMAALRDELAALETEDADRIESATTAKLDALRAVRDAAGPDVPPPSRADIEAAQALNALAQARTRVLMSGTDHRLRSLAAAAGRAPGLTYGRDGRTSL